MSLTTNTVLTTSIVGATVLFLSVIAGLAWYTSSAGNSVPNNQASEDKMTVLNEALRSALGPRWPFVLLAFVIMIGIMLFLFYNISKNPVQLNLSDNGTKIFNWSFIIFVCVFTLFVAVLSVRQYLQYSQQQNNGGNIPNYTPNSQQQKKNMQILAIVGLTVFIIVAGIIGYKYMRSSPIATP